MMGQYFLVANLDKEEFVHPHSLGTGAKLWEICRNGVGGLLLFLLRRSSEGGGGDIRKEYRNAGRWAGDRIVVVGDYDESRLYETARENWKDVSKEVNGDYGEFIRS